MCAARPGRRSISRRVMIQLGPGRCACNVRAHYAHRLYLDGLHAGRRGPVSKPLMPAVPARSAEARSLAARRTTHNHNAAIVNLANRGHQSQESAARARERAAKFFESRTYAVTVIRVMQDAAGIMSVLGSDSDIRERGGALMACVCAHTPVLCCIDEMTLGRWPWIVSSGVGEAVNQTN